MKNNTTNDWSGQAPAKPGNYEIRCMEGGDKAEPAVVIRRAGRLMASMSAFPLCDVKSIHNGLRDVKWRRVCDQWLSPFETKPKSTAR